ncbi:MAG TPA: hypothetical protein VMM92_04610 [Thermoanaerobaculia bacterium]|nr:hypothetical protein [Thermoanaerobaculia bacterium]
MAKNPNRVSTESPTLPLPPPREATAIHLDQFFEVATAAALRSLDAHTRQLTTQTGHPRIWLGIIIENQHPGQVEVGSLERANVNG